MAAEQPCIIHYIVPMPAGDVLSGGVPDVGIAGGTYGAACGEKREKLGAPGGELLHMGSGEWKRTNCKKCKATDAWLKDSAPAGSGGAEEYLDRPQPPAR